MEIKIYPKVIFPEIREPLNIVSPKEAQRYFEWYISIMEVRIKILEEMVNTELGIWHADFTRNSLFDLGKWIKKTAAYRKISIGERKAIIEREGLKNRVADWTMEVEKALTDDTKYRCFDFGIYFGETIRNQVPNLKWVIEKRKSLHFFHSPVLTKIKERPKICQSFNPEPISFTMVNRLLEEDSEESVGKIYDFWVENFTIGYQPPPGVTLY